MAWSAVNKVLDLFRDRNEEGVPISDEGKDASKSDDQRRSRSELIQLDKNAMGGDPADLTGEVKSDIASQADSSDGLDDSDESVTIAADDIGKAGNSTSGSQAIQVERISSVLSIRSTPCSPLQRRKLFARTKSEDTAVSFFSSTSSELNRNEPLPSSVDQVLEASFPFRRDRLLELLSSVKKKEAVDDQRVEKEYDEAKRVEYKVERFVSRSKANISAQLLSDDSDVTTVLSDESYETCECDLEPSSSEAESVGGESEPTEEQEELQVVRLDRFLENLSDTSEQNEREEEFSENNSLDDSLTDANDVVDGGVAETKKNYCNVSSKILAGNKLSHQEGSKDNEAQNVLSKKDPTINSNQFSVGDIGKITGTNQLEANLGVFNRQAVNRELGDPVDRIPSDQLSLKMKQGRVDKADPDVEEDIIDDKINVHEEPKGEKEKYNLEEVELKSVNSAIYEYAGDVHNITSALEEKERINSEGGKHRLIVGRKDDEIHDQIKTDGKERALKIDDDVTKTYNENSEQMNNHVENVELVPDNDEKQCYHLIENALELSCDKRAPNVGTEQSSNRVAEESNTMFSEYEHFNPQVLKQGELTHTKCFPAKTDTAFCQLEEHDLEASDVDILEQKDNQDMPTEQSQTELNAKQTRNGNDYGKQQDLNEHGDKMHTMKEPGLSSYRMKNLDLELDHSIVIDPCNDLEINIGKINNSVQYGQNVEGNQEVTDVHKMNDRLIEQESIGDFAVNEIDRVNHGIEEIEVVDEQSEKEEFSPKRKDVDVESSRCIGRLEHDASSVQGAAYDGDKSKMNSKNIQSVNDNSGPTVIEDIDKNNEKNNEKRVVELETTSVNDKDLLKSGKLDELCDINFISGEETLSLLEESSNVEEGTIEVIDDHEVNDLDKNFSSNNGEQNMNVLEEDIASVKCSETMPASPKSVKLLPIKVNDLEKIVISPGQTQMDLKPNHEDKEEASARHNLIQERSQEFMKNTELYISEREDGVLDVADLNAIENFDNDEKTTSKLWVTSAENDERKFEQPANPTSVQLDSKRPCQSTSSNERTTIVEEPDEVTKNSNFDLKSDATDAKQLSSLSNSDARKVSKESISDSKEERFVGLTGNISSIPITNEKKSYDVSGVTPFPTNSDDVGALKVSGGKKHDSIVGLEPFHNCVIKDGVKNLPDNEVEVEYEKQDASQSHDYSIKEGGVTNLQFSDSVAEQDNISSHQLSTSIITKDGTLSMNGSTGGNQQDSAADLVSAAGINNKQDGVAGVNISADQNKNDRSTVPKAPASVDNQHDGVINLSEAADGIKQDGVAGLKASPDATLIKALSQAVDAAAFEVSKAAQQRLSDDGSEDSFQQCHPPKRAKKNFDAGSAVSSFDLSHYHQYVRQSSHKGLVTRMNYGAKMFSDLEEREKSSVVENKENIECIQIDLESDIVDGVSEMPEENRGDEIASQVPKTTRKRGSINNKIAVFNKERDKIIADSIRKGQRHNKDFNVSNPKSENLHENDQFAPTDNTSEIGLIIRDKICYPNDNRTAQPDESINTKKPSPNDKKSTKAKRIIKKVKRSVTRVLSPQNENKPEDQFADPAILIPSCGSILTRLSDRLSSPLDSKPSPSAHPSGSMKEGKVSGQKESKVHSEGNLPTSDEVQAVASQPDSHWPTPERQSVQVFRSLQSTWQGLSTASSASQGRCTDNMAAVDTAPLPFSKRVVWPRKIDNSDVIKAIPPWAEPGAQPPPPPLTHYTPFSPPTARRQIRPDDSDLSNLPSFSKQSKMSKSKSESQLNNYGTLFSLKTTSTSAVPFKSAQRSGLNKSERSLFKLGQRDSSEATVSHTGVRSWGGVRAADHANDITSAYVAAAAAGANNNAALKTDLQITVGGGVTGAPGQGARSSHVGDITAAVAQSTTSPATDQAQPRQQRFTDMVTVRTGSESKMGPGGALLGVGGEQVAPTPGSGGKVVATAGKFGPSVAKGKPGGVKVSGVSVGVAGGGTDVGQDVPWRKGEASAKAAHMPASPRLETRKNVSGSQSSQASVAQPPVIKEQNEELPDAPWRKSPQQPRKTAPPVQEKTTSTAHPATVPAAASAPTVAAPPPKAATTAPSKAASTTTPSSSISSKTISAGQSVEEEITKTVRESSVKSSVSVKQESSFFSSSLVSESGQKDAFVATTEVSSSSSSTMPSATIVSQTGSNPANLPPHVPPQHKKITGSPRGSPKGSPILPRRGAQSTPPPAPSASTKPAVPPATPTGAAVPATHAPVMASVPSVPAVNNAAAVASFSSVSSTLVSVADSSAASATSSASVAAASSVSSAAFSAGSVLNEQPPPIVLRNTVVPLPDEKASEKVKTAKTENEEKVREQPPPPSLAPAPTPAPKVVPSNEHATIADTKPTIESSNDNKAAIKSVFAAESAQFEYLSSSQAEESFSPPPPPSLPEPPISGQDSVQPPLPPPPPATFITEDPKAVSSIPFNILPLEKDKEEYVPVPVTSRIRSFEKQSSMDDYYEEKPAPQQVRPVGPWVKKTSSGPVAPQEGWELSPEGEAWPRPPPPPPQQYSEAPSSPPSSSRGPHPHSPYQIPQKPHTYQPQVYQSPAQLEKMQKQQQRSAPAPPPHQQHRQQQQQQHQRVPQQSLAYLEQESTPPRLPRTRTGSTSEQLSQSYCLAQNAQASVSVLGGDVPLPSPALTQLPTTQPGQKDPYFDPWCDPENPRVIQFQDVSAAAFKIKSGIMNTPCTRSHMSALTGVEIFFKKEFNQYTGSFKERGARYTLLSLTEKQRVAGVIAASAGNHALALSYHGQDLGIPVTVVMPLVAPIMKVQACRQYGANILVRGSDIAECRMIALKMAKEQGLLYINGYDHPHILAGQGTMGLEIVEQVPNIDAVVVPVGGGGLIAGVALAVKALYPQIQVIGVESEMCPSFSAALANGRPTYTKAESTLADGLAVPTVGVNAFATASTLVDKVVTVREEWIAIAILRLVELEKAVVEGAGATALAAILAGELPELKGKRVVIPLCGGNIDTTVLGRCLERGLAADGRLVKFTVTVSDRPGGIAELTRLMASLGVSIKDMTHERAWIRSDIFSVEVKVLCETRDFEHFLELKVALEERYKILRFAMPDQIHAETDF